MQRPSFPFFLFLLLSALWGLHTANWVDRYAEAQMADVEPMLEIASEPDDEAPHPYSITLGSGGDDSVFLPAGFQGFAKGFAVLLSHSEGKSVAIRQSQVNLLASLQVPPFFILYHSFQGYIS